MHDQQIGRRRHERDGRQVLHRIVRHLAHQAHVDREIARLPHQYRITVGRGLGYVLRADVAGRAAAVFDHDLLAEAFAEFLADDAREDVVRAAGRVR
jgi:hypothetical protein